MTHRTGFTLLECLVTVVLCGFLAAVSIRFYAGAIRQAERILHDTRTAAALITTLERIDAQARLWLRTVPTPDPGAFQRYMESVASAETAPGIRITLDPLHYRIGAIPVTAPDTLFLITVATDTLRLSRVIGL